MTTVVCVPNCLGSSSIQTEELIQILANQQIGPICLDFRHVTWVRPYGVVMLLGSCQHWAARMQSPIQFTYLAHEVHRYLRRVNFFQLAGDTISMTETFDPLEDLGRSHHSDSIMELIPITASQDIFTVVAHVREILQMWLQADTDDIDYIVCLLSEACSNIIDHSRANGMVTIQKYQYSGERIAIHLAIADFGCGIEATLHHALGKIAESSAGYLAAAIAGRSSREGESGGQGLGTIREIATRSGGNVYLRSGTAALLFGQQSKAQYDNLVAFPGTQIAITFLSTVSL